MIIKSDRIIFNAQDWTSGLNTQWDTNVSLVSGQTIADATAFNPLRPFGIAAPGLKPTAVTNVSTVTGRIVSGVPKYVSGSALAKAILLGDDGKVQELTFLTKTITNSGGTFPYSISHGGHSTVVGEDIVTYSVGSTRYAFYSFRDATDWDVGRYDFSTTFDDDYMSTVPATPLAAPYLTGGKDYPHPMFVGADDVLYIGDRNFLHAFDGQVGASGTFYAAVLTLPQGYVITSFARTENFLVIFGYREDRSSSDGSVYGEATAFFWDYLSLDPTKVIDLDDNYVNGGFTWKGTVGCFTTGRPSEYWAGSGDNKKSDLRLFNGTEFESVATYDGSPPIFRGVDIIGSEVMWCSDASVYQYAEKFKGSGYRFNRIGSAGVGSESGWLKTITTTEQYISSGDGTSGGLLWFEPDSFSSGSFRTIYAKPETPMGQISKLKAVELHLYNKGTAGQNAMTLNVKYLGGATSEQTIVSGVDAFSSAVSIYYEDTSEQELSNFSRIGLEVAWSASGAQTSCPMIDQIILYFEPLNV